MPNGSDDGATARFDDLATGTAVSFVRPSRVLTATRPKDVVPLLTEVERATAAGSWAFGYLTYEAAPGLDPRWAVADRTAADALPLATFALCERAERVPPVPPPRGRQRSYRVGPWTPAWTESGHRAAAGRVSRRPRRRQLLRGWRPAVLL